MCGHTPQNTTHTRLCSCFCGGFGGKALQGGRARPPLGPQHQKYKRNVSKPEKLVSGQRTGLKRPWLQRRHPGQKSATAYATVSPTRRTTHHPNRLLKLYNMVPSEFTSHTHPAPGSTRRTPRGAKNAVIQTQKNCEILCSPQAENAAEFGGIGTGVQRRLVWCQKSGAKQGSTQSKHTLKSHSTLRRLGTFNQISGVWQRNFEINPVPTAPCECKLSNGMLKMG